MERLTLRFVFHRIIRFLCIEKILFLLFILELLGEEWTPENCSCLQLHVFSCLQELEKGLKDVHVGVLDSAHVENIVQVCL